MEFEKKNIEETSSTMIPWLKRERRMLCPRSLNKRRASLRSISNKVKRSSVVVVAAVVVVVDDVDMKKMMIEILKMMWRWMARGRDGC